MTTTDSPAPPMPHEWPSGTALRLSARLWRPVDAASLAAFRILFGTVLVFGLVRFVLQGWIEVLYVEPQIFLKYWGFEWVRVWPRWGMYAHYAALSLLAVSIAVGYRTRLAALLFFLGFTYVELMDVTNYLNHYYLVSVIALLLVFLPMGRIWSVDAFLGRTAGAVTVPAWCVYLLRFQIAVVYFYAGLAKLGEDWLLHAQPLGIWLAARNETPLIGAWLDVGWMPYAMSWAGFLFDSTIVLFLSMRRTRVAAYALVLVFHSMTHVFFDIGLFPFLMTAFATIFFEPDWPRRLSSFGFARRAGDLEPERAAAPDWSRARLAGACVIAAFCVVQIAVPLRHFAYPGSVLWNEQGMRWAWKVMAREKNGSITYHAYDPDSGKRWQVSPTRYLTWRQANEMAGQPDLILQMAHHVAAELRGRGVARPQVRVEAWVSLNGRQPSLMIDPEIDLAAVTDGLEPDNWILPPPQDPPLSAGSRPLPANAG